MIDTNMILLYRTKLNHLPNQVYDTRLPDAPIAAAAARDNGTLSTIHSGGYFEIDSGLPAGIQNEEQW